MTQLALKHRYHDSVLEDYRIGPRRELILDIRLDEVWNPDGPRAVRVRFGAIENMDEVGDFFQHGSTLKLPDCIDRLALLEAGKWELKLDRAGTLLIATQKGPEEE